MVSYEYIAGFIDGEGCFSISYVLDDTGQSIKRFALRVDVTNNHEGVLNSIRETLGCGLVFSRGIRHKSKRVTHVYRITKLQEIIDVLPKLIPFLVVKKKQAEMMLEYAVSRLDKSRWSMTRNERGQVLGIQRPYSHRDMELVNMIRVENSILNGRDRRWLNKNPA